MKRNLIMLLALILTFVFFHNAYAEPYISKNFPPDKILSKLEIRGLTNLKILGFFKDKNNKYILYITYFDEGWKKDKNLNPYVELIKLNTDIWIISYKGEFQILQK